MPEVLSNLVPLLQDRKGRASIVTRAKDGHTEEYGEEDDENLELERNAEKIAHLAIFITLLYIALGVVVLCISEKWTVIDSLYFVIVTLTTVGYGDQADWSGEGIMLFQALYSLGGIMLMSAALGIIAGFVFEKQEKALQEARAKMQEAQMELAKKAAAGGNRFSLMSPKNNLNHTRKKAAARCKAFVKRVCPEILKDLAPHLLQLFVILVVGMVLIYYDHDNDEDSTTPTFIECFYFAVITGTTIGYGDYSPQTQTGRVISVIYVLASVVTLGGVLGDVAGYFVEKKKREGEGWES